MPEEEQWFSTDGLNVTMVKDPDVEVSDAELREAFRSHPELAALENWVASFSALDQHGLNRSRRSTGIFERDRYVNPVGVWDQFRVARDASLNDDIVSGLLEATESLAFNKIRVECGDEDEENVWDQILRDIKLDLRIREIWRDLYIYSQSYVASFWRTKQYRVEGFGDQRRRRKTMRLNVPSDLTLLDPLKVLPVGDFLFDRERLVYVANKAEGPKIADAVAGRNTTDQVIAQLIVGKYVPDTTELGLLQEAVGTAERGFFDNLFELNPQLVWRHTLTRSAYERFAPVHMQSIFELLDLKHQLRQNDRAHLLGATNFIVVVKKGSDAHPATSGEISNLQNNVRMVARTPVIVGDHRLDIEIVTPNLDTTLDPKRYNNLDSRITARLAQILHIGGFSAGASGDDSLKLTRVIARGIESRRQMIKQQLERKVLDPIFEMNDELKFRPKLEFTPRNVALDFDPNFLQTIRELYQSGDLSRETMLGIVDHDQEEEAHRREVEAEQYDDIFEPREQTQGQQGARLGGNQNGGGDNPDSRVSNPKPRRNDNDTPEDDRRDNKE